MCPAKVPDHDSPPAAHLHPQAFAVTRKDRERLGGHAGRVVWLTGLSGSGKSTIANALERELHSQGKRTYVLDGDNIRRGLNRDLGFSDADRAENIRRIAHVAHLFVEAGLIVVVAFISPFRAERQAARELFAPGDFLEVFVEVPLALAEQRDPKGLYKKARAGELRQFTGIDSPYEAPTAPEVVLPTARLTVQECVQQICERL